MNKFFKKIISNKKGTALLMTILILNVIIIISLAASKLVASGVKMSGTQLRSTRAYFAAESGAERILWEWRKNSWPIPMVVNSQPNLFSGKLLNNSAYQVDKATSTIIIFQSQGSYFELQRTVELELVF